MLMLLLTALTSTAVPSGSPSAVYVNCAVDPGSCQAKTFGPVPTGFPPPRPGPCAPGGPRYTYTELTVSQVVPSRRSLLQDYLSLPVTLKSNILGDGPGVLLLRDPELGKQLRQGFTVENIFTRDGLIVMGLCHLAPPE